MVQIANTAKLHFKEALAAAGIKTSFSDDRISELISEFRERLNTGRPNTIAEESQLMAAAIRPLYDAILGEADLTPYDSDQLGALFWDLYVACTSNTQSAPKCLKLNEDEEAWADRVSLLLAAPRAPQIVITNPWTTRIAIFGWILLCALFVGVLSDGRRMPTRYFRSRGPTRAKSESTKHVRVFHIRSWFS